MEQIGDDVDDFAFDRLGVMGDRALVPRIPEVDQPQAAEEIREFGVGDVGGAGITDVKPAVGADALGELDDRGRGAMIGVEHCSPWWSCGKGLNNSFAQGEPAPGMSHVTHVLRLA